LLKLQIFDFELLVLSYDSNEINFRVDEHIEINLQLLFSRSYLIILTNPNTRSHTLVIDIYEIFCFLLDLFCQLNSLLFLQILNELLQLFPPF
jgi:hypothetical protein